MNLYGNYKIDCSWNVNQSVSKERKKDNSIKINLGI